jgi:hypothetical protein
LFFHIIFCQKPNQVQEANNLGVILGTLIVIGGLLFGFYGVPMINELDISPTVEPAQATESMEPAQATESMECGGDCYN